MASRWHSFSIEPVGGLNLDESPNAIRKEELREALNVYYAGQTLKVRPGMQYESETNGYTSALPGAVQGMFEWRVDNDDTRRMIVVANGDVYQTNGSGAPAALTDGAGVSITAGSTRRWTFAQHGYGSNLRLFGAGGTGTDTPWYWDGSAGSTTFLDIDDSAAANVSPTFIFSKWKRLFACGWRTAAGALSVDIAADPMTPRYTPLNEPTVWPVRNTFAGRGIGGLPAYGDEYLTGFGDYTDNDGDWLIIMSNKKLYAVQQAPDANTPFFISGKGAIEFGCVSQHAYVPLGLDSGDAIYLSYNGIHSLRQTQTTGGAAEAVLSWKIRTLFKTLNRSALDLASGTYLREEGIVVFAVPVGSSTSPDLLLVLDTKDTSEKDLTAESARWTTWRIAGSTQAARTVVCMAPVRTATGAPYIYCGMADGGVARFSNSVETDRGASFPARASTAWSDFGDPTRDKTLGDLYIQAGPVQTTEKTLKLTVTTDFGNRTYSPINVDLPYAVGIVLDTTVFDDGVFGTESDTSFDRVYAIGRGMNFSFTFERNGASFYVSQLAGRVSGAGMSPGVN